MKSSLGVLNNNIRVAGCDFTEVSLRFEVVDEATLAKASECLQIVGRCEEWWWGDYLVAYAQHKLEADHSAEDLRGMAEEDQEAYRRHCVRNHGSVLMGTELADTQMERYKVASFYKCSIRIPGPEITPTHHRVAMDYCEGDVSVAQDWLDKAKANGWSKNELAFEMKKAKKGQLTDPPRRTESLQHELFGACRWAMATTKRVPEMELEEVRRTRANLKPLVALDQSLADVEQRMAGVAKESLPAAA